MKKRWRVPAFLAALVWVAALAGCGGSSASTAASAPAEAQSYSAAEKGWGGEAAALDEAVGGAGNEPAGAAEGRKIIYTGRLDLESTDFPAACSQLLEAVDRVGGYVQSSNQSGSAEDADRWAEYVFRIPSSHYSEFLNDAQNAGNPTYKSEETQDVTSTYVDVEARLSSLRGQRERLLALEKKAENLEDLLAIEEQLAQVQYEIENYTGQKKVLDDQIDASTVTVSVREVRTLTPAQNSFAARLAAAFAGGWKGFGRGLQDFAVALAGGLPWLILLALVATGALLLIKRGAGKRAQRPLKHDPWAARPPRQPQERGEEGEKKE